MDLLGSSYILIIHYYGVGVLLKDCPSGLRGLGCWDLWFKDFGFGVQGVGIWGLEFKG